jgi:alkylhydroperoxidase family enzyme
VAALDGDWTDATPADRAAYAFARKVSFEPHKLTDADIAGLRTHYTDLQILEMILSVAANNQINRWKEGAGIPQSKDSHHFARKAEKPLPKDRVLPIETYLTPTSEKYKSAVTRVAPTAGVRPGLEPRAAVEAALAAARARTPRLPLVAEDKARELMGATGPVPQWVRLLANFPGQGKARALAQLAAEEKGDLSPLLKAQVSWIVARQDRAWYAAGLAKQRLLDLGQTEDQVYALDGDWAGFTPAERAQFTLARQLAASPIALTDAEVAEAVKLVGPRDVVQLITYTTTRASFDRITEAAGLRLER